jgi:hypothetical protein
MMISWRIFVADPSHPAATPHTPVQTTMLRRAVALAVALSSFALQAVAGQQARRGPDDVVRAVLRADSVNDWRSLLALTHPDAITMFRESTVREFTFDGSEFPGMPARVSDAGAIAFRAHLPATRACRNHVIRISGI